jgi:uncharacterized protein (TIGR02391 family)
MTVLQEAIPNPEALLALEPEELGGVILSQFDRFVRDSRLFHRQDVYYFDPSRSLVERHPKFDEIDQAISEAVYWLDRAGITMPAPGSNGQAGFRILSRRGRELKRRGGLQRFQAGALLPAEMLHHKLAQSVWPLFIRGDHGPAVLQAFIEVEIAVRAAAGLQQELVGVALMRAAFNPDTGALADQETVKSEREGIMQLFAGAIGGFKNPLSHREVGLDASKGSAEMIVMASHLLRIVDDRVARRNAPAAAQ